MESALLISSTLNSQVNGVVDIDTDFIGSRDRVIHYRLVDKLSSNNHADIEVKVKGVKRYFKKDSQVLKLLIG
jgi:hypothetical protein